MKKVLFATENESKVNRFKDKLLEYNIEIISINDIDKKVIINETGKTVIENALIKARSYSNMYNIVFAMDDSLYIEGIPEDREPLLMVRRVNGKKLTDEEMIEYYSNLAKTYGENGRLLAKWVYGIALINNGKEYTYTFSKEDFYIVSEPSNIINKGYPLNSISINKKLNKYFTDITREDKETLKEDESDVIEFLCKNI